jgi:hypothetical protein
MYKLLYVRGKMDRYYRVAQNGFVVVTDFMKTSLLTDDMVA